jgi:hypothetical protein
MLLMLTLTASMLKPVLASTKYRKASIFGKDAMSPILQCAGVYSTVPTCTTYCTVPLSWVAFLKLLRNLPGTYEL